MARFALVRQFGRIDTREDLQLIDRTEESQGLVDAAREARAQTEQRLGRGAE